jgi:hypothetical protein
MNPESEAIIGEGVVAMALLSGCNSAKSHESVANDVSAAQMWADAEREASNSTAKATSKVDDETRDLNNVVLAWT